MTGSSAIPGIGGSDLKTSPFDEDPHSPAEKKDISRKSFLVGIASLSALFFGSLSWFGGWFRRPGREVTAVAPDFRSGHRLRVPFSPGPVRTSEKTAVAIIGGGISGLCAAWWLRKRGFEDFRILELESDAGGNSAGDSHDGLKFPMGAHYLPEPGADAHLVRELLRDAGVLTDSGYREEMICGARQERLHIYNRWQEGVFPRTAARDSDLEEFEKFSGLMTGFRRAKGSDGRHAFAIPLAESSADRKFRQYDEMTMAQFLHRNGFQSRRLRWYVNYCCLDDYGAGVDLVSAWAGIHYFAARDRENQLLTWPEGNGFLTDWLKEKAGNRLQTGRLVRLVEEEGDGFRIHLFHGEETRSLTARKVIWAAPEFALPHMMPGAPKQLREAAGSLIYSPWLVVNLLLDRLPDSAGGDVAWDNVLYGGRGLGYIDSAHQLFSVKPARRAWTYYLPFGDRDTLASRRFLLRSTGEEIADLAFQDLAPAHPDLAEVTSGVRYCAWAHAMIRPLPGLFGSGSPLGVFHGSAVKGIFHANSDSSGMSNFEEAQYRGVRAAAAALASL